MPDNRRRWNRLSISSPECTFNPRLHCKGQSESFHCPIQDDRFTDLLDLYFMGGKREDAVPGVVVPRDINAIPQMTCKQVALWFDNDFHALESYCLWKREIKDKWEDEAEFMRRTLRMTYQLCQEFRRAWCRYYVQTQPLEVQRPGWMRGWDRWKGSSVAWCRENGLVA